MLAQSLGHIIIKDYNIGPFSIQTLSIILFNTVFVTLGFILRPSSQFYSELFGPGHFIGLGLGLRLKSEIRTRTRTPQPGQNKVNLVSYCMCLHIKYYVIGST
jgi:hypothetical protein